MPASPFKVLIKSPFSTWSGYGQDGWGMARALVKWGADVYVQPTWLDVPIPQDLLPLFAKPLIPPFDLTINHWDPTNLGIREEARRCTRLAVAWCVDELTEIFTRRGWLRWDEVMEGDQALGINPESSMSEWQEVRRVYRSGSGKRSMVELRGPGHLSVSTPDHRWLIKTRAGEWAWRTSEELLAGDSIPCQVSCAELPATPKYTDAFVELVAWAYTEGWLERGKSVRIGQNERVYPSNVSRIRAALWNLLGKPKQTATPKSCALCGSDKPDSRGRVTRARGLCHTCYERERGRGTLGDWAAYSSWSESRKPDGMVIFSISRPASQELLSVCRGKFPAQEFLLTLTQAQLNLFIDVSMLADGHETFRRRSFAQALGPGLEAFVTAAVLAGKRPGRPSSTKKHPHLANLYLMRRPFSQLPEQGVTKEYDGVVWCPSVKHGNWLARRDGRVFYTGNSMWEFSSLKPHCRGRSTLKERLKWYDLVLGYDPVSLGALAPYIPAHVARGVLLGGFDAGNWSFQDRNWFSPDFGFAMHGALNNRKQPMLVIQAFLELLDEHPEEFAQARLTFHTSTGPLFPELTDIFAREGKRIKVYQGTWDDKTLKEFYAAQHCLVYPSRGEGKNVPALEFLSTGGTVIHTKRGGPEQWLREDIAYPVPFVLRPTVPRYPHAAQDARVEVADLKKVMWDVFTHREEARCKGELASKIIPTQYDWSVAVEDLFRRIRDLCGTHGEIIYNLAQACRRDQGLGS